MSERKIEVRMLRIDEIRPNPFQPRESFPKEDIQQLAESIKTFGLLQPIVVRRKGKTYEIIAGERRWRAAHFAGLKEIPAIVKDATDVELMMQSLIENVHRKDLEPIEKARGLAEVYRLAGFEPARIQFQLKNISDVVTRPERHRELTDEEKKIKEIADMIGLSYDYQYRLLTLLRFTPEEQRRVSELKLGYEEASSIATIEQPEVRKKIIELAPELRREEVKKLSKIVKKAPEPVVKAVLERKITPDVAEVIAEVKEPEVMEKVLEKATKGVYTVEGIKTIVARLEKPPIELPEEPIEVQIHNKILWNLKRIGDYDFYTIGFAKRTVDQFLELLRLKNVRTLVDVRKNPKSMFRPEFNRENLEKVLTAQGITYIHYPELGVPEEIREKLAETGDYNWFFNWYDNNVLPNLDEVDLETLAYPIALMCVEFDPTRCHRHRIALALEKRGLKGCDL
jgi:ParB family chromosome partitioning protein